MTSAAIREQLQLLAASPDVAEQEELLVKELRNSGAGLAAVRPILTFMEAHPEIDLGMPGPLVHFVELAAVLAGVPRSRSQAFPMVRARRCWECLARDSGRLLLLVLIDLSSLTGFTSITSSPKSSGSSSTALDSTSTPRVTSYQSLKTGIWVSFIVR